MKLGDPRKGRQSNSEISWRKEVKTLIVQVEIIILLLIFCRLKASWLKPVQVELHSPRLPSSHVSSPIICPSPHIVLQIVGDYTFPPTQSNP